MAPLRVIAGGLLILLGGALYFGCVGGAIAGLEIERTPFRVPVTFAIASTFSVGFLMRQGLRLMYPTAAGFFPPFLVRACLWFGVLLCGGAAARIVGRLVADERFEDFDTAAVGWLLLICLWFGMLQLLVLFRLPQIARSLDENEGAIL